MCCAPGGVSVVAQGHEQAEDQWDVAIDCDNRDEYGLRMNYELTTCSAYDDTPNSDHLEDGKKEWPSRKL